MVFQIIIFNIRILLIFLQYLLNWHVEVSHYFNANYSVDIKYLAHMTT